MDLEKVREYCLKKKGVTESLPFDEDTPVYKVMGKMFCLANLNPPISINLKCDPEKAIELREKYDDVQPGYHMSKEHWNTVFLANNISDKLIYGWIDDSYNLVAAKLSKADKEKLGKS
ncbi:MAG: MmcQ/YjbR family DNA-binding protein [Ignavibacteriaceae bacterium]|nr:MmcQ/YjbR family DNA-binding protein [Ignavibacteriaceae bacterium]